MSYLNQLQALHEIIDKEDYNNMYRRTYSASISLHIGLILAVIYHQFFYKNSVCLRPENRKLFEEKEGWFTLTFDELARYAGVARSKCSYYVSRLVKLKMIECRRNLGGKNEYKLLPKENWTFISGEKNTNDKNDSSKKGLPQFKKGTGEFKKGTGEFKKGTATPFQVPEIIDEKSPLINRILTVLLPNENTVTMEASASKQLNQNKMQNKSSTNSPSEFTGSCTPGNNTTNTTPGNNTTNTTPGNKLDGSCTPESKFENTTPENKFEINDAQNITEDLTAPPPAPQARKGRRTTVPGQKPKKLQHTSAEEQFAQKVYEKISARFPKQAKIHTWPKVKQSWCLGLRRACNANGGFEFVSEAIWWALNYDSFTKKNMRSLAQINKQWKNGDRCIENIISKYIVHLLSETMGKKATPKFIWKTAYYTLRDSYVPEEQACVWADKITEVMTDLQFMIEKSYEKRNAKLNYYWFLEKDFLKFVNKLAIECHVQDLWNDLSDIINNFGDNLYDRLQSGNITWLERNMFNPIKIIEEYHNG